MSDSGTVIYPGTIRFERMLPGTPVRVWEYLTVPAMLTTWLAKADMDLCVGGRVELQFDVDEVPERKQHGGGSVCGVISRCAPPHLLSYSWMDSIVTFELKPSAGKEVQLVLTHSGLAESLVHKCCAGWHAHLDTLLARLCGKKPEAFPALFERLSKHYKQQVNKNIQKERRRNVSPTGMRKDRRRMPRGGDFS